MTSLNQWQYIHPNIQKSFYDGLPVPESLEDASIRHESHNQAVRDFDMQIQILGYEMEQLADLPYKVSERDALKDKRIKLMAGKRFHCNAGNAYWYWIQRKEETIKSVC